MKLLKKNHLDKFDSKTKTKTTLYQLFSYLLRAFLVFEM